jgi:hypothetical protein
LVDIQSTDQLQEAGMGFFGKLFNRDAKKENIKRKRATRGQTQALLRPSPPIRKTAGRVARHPKAGRRRTKIDRDEARRRRATSTAADRVWKKGHLGQRDMPHVP